MNQLISRTLHSETNKQARMQSPIGRLGMFTGCSTVAQGAMIGKGVVVVVAEHGVGSEGGVGLFF